MVVQENPYHYSMGRNAGPPSGGVPQMSTTTTTTRVVYLNGGGAQQRDPMEMVQCCGCCSMECGMVMLLIWENLGATSALDRMMRVVQGWSDIADDHKPLYIGVLVLYVLCLIPQIFFIFTFCRYICCTSKPTAADRQKLIRGVEALMLKAVVGYGIVGIVCFFLQSQEWTTVGTSFLLAGFFEVLLLLWWRTSFVQWWRAKLNSETYQ